MGRMKEEFMKLIDKVMEGGEIVVDESVVGDVEMEIECLFNEEVEKDEVYENGEKKVKVRLKKS